MKDEDANSPPGSSSGQKRARQRGEISSDSPGQKKSKQSPGKGTKPSKEKGPLDSFFFVKNAA